MCWAANPLADIHADCDMWICVIDCKFVSLNDIIQRYFKVFYSSEFGKKKCVCIFPCQVKSPKQARTRQGLITGFALFGNTQMRSTQLFQMGEQQNAVDLAILNLLSHLSSKVKKLEKTTFPSQIQTKLFL